MTRYERELLRLDGHNYGNLITWWLGVVLLILFLAVRAAGTEPPAFSVENKCPTFSVVNKTPTAPAGPGKKLLTYDELLARVKAGERMVLGVGPYMTPAGVDGWVEKLQGISPGVYDCRLENGVPVMRPRVTTQDATPGVVAGSPFRDTGLQYNPTHTCPACGYTSPAGTGTWVVRGYAPGGHVHSCPVCGTSWYH